MEAFMNIKLSNIQKGYADVSCSKCCMPLGAVFEQEVVLYTDTKTGIQLKAVRWFADCNYVYGIQNDYELRNCGHATRKQAAEALICKNCRHKKEVRRLM